MLEQSLSQIKKRIRLLLIERHALLLGTIGAALGVVCVILSRWYFSIGEPPVLFGLVAAGLISGSIWGMLIKLSPYSVARAVEKRLNLKERLSSAVALSQTDDDMVHALITDAVKHAENINPKAVFPVKFDKNTAGFLASIVVLIGIFYLPQLPRFQSDIRRAEIAVMKREGKKLQKLANEAKKQSSPKNKEIAQQVALNMKKLGKKLETGRMNRKQAMVALKKLSKEIQTAQDKIAENNKPGKTMEQAARELKDVSPTLAKDMLERIQKEKLKNLSLGKTDPQLASMEKQIKDMQAKSGAMSNSDLQKAEQSLSKYLSSQNGANMPPELASIMAELMKNGDYKRAMELMNELSKKLKSGNMSKMDQKNLEEQLKALAKALKNTDLEELAKKLREAAEKLAKMDPKEAAKLLAQCKCKKPGLGLGLGMAGAGCNGAACALGGCGMSGIGAGGPGNSKYKEVKGPIVNSNKGYVTKSSTNVGKEGMIFSAGETKGAPDKAGSSSVPYYEVYSDYKKQAEKALSKEDVPPAYKKPVQDYFESLHKGE